MWLISKKVDFEEIAVPRDEPDAAKATKQANVARLREQAAMVNESHALTTNSTHLPAPKGPQAPDEENQKSSLSLKPA